MKDPETLEQLIARKQMEHKSILSRETWSSWLLARATPEIIWPAVVLMAAAACVTFCLMGGAP